ncbi:hypothetical protein A9Q81_07765 [Gammaproteobacteria bacterium 42_54_T18]|nr:hypothetical protein A9Q81_07765 [Gammaproteobacteria bacterium 42_54_T18]
MEAQKLNFFPRLNTVLSEAYRNELKETLERDSHRLAKASLNTYTAFVDIVIHQLSSPYSALDIRNNDEKLNHHFSMYVGFIHTEFDQLSIYSVYKYCFSIKNALKNILAKSDTSLKNIKLSPLSISDDVLSCISQYQSHRINSPLLEYYSGWSCQSKEGKSLHLNIAKYFDKFGSAYTVAIHETISNYIRTLKKETARNTISRLAILLNTFSDICGNHEELESALKAENSTKFMLNVYHVLLSKAIQNDNCVESFTEDWSLNYIPKFTSCFIETGFFEEPNTPFIAPKFKSPKNRSQAISIGGKFISEEKERIFVDIPLEIKDEKALGIIESRLKLDLKHIRISFQNAVDEIMQRHARNIEYIKHGKVKHLSVAGTNNHAYVTGEAFPIGLKEHPGNTIATFHHHGFGGPSRNYAAFLGEKNNSQLVKELNIPTPSTLMAFSALLVIEHPKITPSWLQEWQLFDKNDNQVGFKQVGKKWVAVSFKNRKGATLAQQEIHLTEHSKCIVEGLIEHTKYTRSALKKVGDSGWRYVMLSANLTVPKRLNNINSSILSSKGFHRFLILDSFDDFGEPILNKESAKKLAPLVSLRSIRKTRGLQIYIETHSIRAVADALGHKEANLSTLSSYLPEPLMDYFNARWVRIFQNSIIFEALKDSPYLFDALDFNEEALDEFLNNHSLGELPEQLKKANDCLLVEEHQNQTERLDELVYTLSTPLFQVLIAIQTIIETATKEDVFVPIIEKWYEAAVFILDTFSLTNKAKRYRPPPQEAKHMYEHATNNPLDLELFKENLLCR